MLMYLVVLCIGVFLGQEYGTAIPNVREKFYQGCFSLKDYLDTIERTQRN